MRVAIISAPARSAAPPEYVKSLAKGIESTGSTVQIFNAWGDDSHMIPAFDYIVIVAEATAPIRGKMPGALEKFIGSGIGFEGKKGAAFLKKRLANGRAMARLMELMEKQGMFVNWSDIIISPAHAEALGKRFS
jgi:hypothetical protein